MNMLMDLDHVRINVSINCFLIIHTTRADYKIQIKEVIHIIC